MSLSVLFPDQLLFGDVGFCGGLKLKKPWGKPSDQVQNQQLNPHIAPDRIPIQATFLGSKRSRHCAICAQHSRYNNPQTRQVENLPGRRISRSFLLNHFFPFLFAGGKRFWRWVSCRVGPHRWVDCVQSKPRWRRAIESNSNPENWMKTFNFLSITLLALRCGWTLSVEMTTKGYQWLSR